VFQFWCSSVEQPSARIGLKGLAHPLHFNWAEVHMTFLRPLRVLVTGASGDAAVAFLTAIRRHDTDVFAADSDPLAAGLQMIGRQRAWAVPAAHDPAYIPSLLVRCQQNEIDMLVPTDVADVRALAEAAEAFEAIGTRVLVSKPECIELCADHVQLMQRLDQTEWAPRWAVYDKKFRGSKWAYPFNLVPRLVGGSEGITVERGLRLLTVRNDGSHIAMEPMDGARFSVHVLCRPDGEVVASVPVEHLRGQGHLPAVARTVNDPELVRAGIEVAQAVGMAFMGTVHLQRNAAGQLKAVAVTPRIAALTPLIVAAGVHLPRLAVELGLEPAKVLPAQECAFRAIGMVRTQRQTFVPADGLTLNQHPNAVRKAG